MLLPVRLALVVLWGLIPLGCGAPTAEAVAVEAAGATLPMFLYRNAFFSYRFVEPGVRLTFDASTAGGALCRLQNYSAECPPGDTDQPRYLDWGSLATAVSPAAYAQYPDLQLYPTVGAAVVPVYNLNGVTDLTLSLETLAKIWSGRITTWDHPDIVATNPNFKSWNIPANQRITLVARRDSAAVTQVFKQSLAAVDPVFRAQVGVAWGPSWNGTQVVLETGAQLLVSRVLQSNYALGYSPMADAIISQVPFSRLNRSGVVVQASSSSVQYALLEQLSFGNNGDDPAHLTADVFNAVNPLAWPIVSYSYIAVRKSTLRPGATCATVAAMAKFWLWFWSSDSVASLATALGFGVLPTVVKEQVVARFKQDIQCAGALAWQEPEVPVVAAYGPGSGVVLFAKFQEAYGLANSSVALNYTALASTQDVTPYLQAGGVVLSTSPLPASANAVVLILAAQALIGISRFALTLDGQTMARILNGDIQTWLHPDIVALNPAGLRDSVTGQVLNDTAQRIVLLQGPTARSAPVTALLQSYYPAYTGAAVQAANRYTNVNQFWSAVLGTPYAFSITSMVGDLPEELQLTAVVARSGAAVAPSLATAQACAENATFDPNTSIVALSLDNRSCYPLLLPLYINLQPQCPTPSATTARAVTFLQWMFSEATLDASLNSLGLVSLSAVSLQVQAHNDDALFQLACGVRPVPATPTNLLPLLLGIIVPIVAVVLLGVGGCGWWLWRVTEHNRLMRKKFSNDNVAESCAEAIARFDLQAVAWLREVKEPNKIQLAFLAIIGLLTEVKPYIPDQLLSRLTAKTNACDSEEEEDETGKLRSVSDHNRRSLRTEDSSQRGRLQSIRSLRSTASPRNHFKGPRFHPSVSVAISDNSHQVQAIRDWTRKRCTYMCVRFGSTSANAEGRLPALVHVAGRIVDLAKAHGATIDAVGVDFVAVHWGVTSTGGASSTPAVQAALEIQQLRSTLPEGQQAAFWLQAGIGKGLCDCGTISSESGHRFFVVWGPEASLAAEIASTNLPRKVQASLLVSPAVYQDAQYTVQCMPRLWHGDVLLWEPRMVLRKKEDDEWMYELNQMGEEASVGHKVLLEAFLQAKTQSAADLAAHVEQLRATPGCTLSPQDSAALDLLLDTTFPHHVSELIVA